MGIYKYAVVDRSLNLFVSFSNLLIGKMSFLFGISKLLN